MTQSSYNNMGKTTLIFQVKHEVKMMSSYQTVCVNVMMAYNDSSNQVTLVISLLSDSISENHIGLSM